MKTTEEIFNDANCTKLADRVFLIMDDNSVKEIIKLCRVDEDTVKLFLSSETSMNLYIVEYIDDCFYLIIASMFPESDGERLTCIFIPGFIDKEGVDLRLVITALASLGCSEEQILFPIMEHVRKILDKKKVSYEVYLEYSSERIAFNSTQKTNIPRYIIYPFHLN